MGFKFKFPQSEKQNPEVAARNFCSEIRKFKHSLKRQTYNPENCKKARKQVNLLRDEYNRNRGNGYCSPSMQFADHVSCKVLEIVDLNPEDWNNYRRGQKFRRLGELLDEEWSRSRETPEPPDDPDNVVPFRT